VTTLGDLIGALEEWYPPATAESWDAVGLTCGDPELPVQRVLLAVDCVPATVTQAVAAGAQLLLTHHPLLLSGVHSVAVTDPKGALVHRLIREQVAHFAAHTNADVARGGVSEALADRIGLLRSVPLKPDPAPGLDHLAVFVPPGALEALAGALAEAGAGAVGSYDRCTFAVEGAGTFRPLPGADPAQGEIGVLSRVSEVRLSMVLPRSRRSAVLAAMRAHHPYEEVAFELTEQPRLDAPTGSGRIGELPTPLRLREFVDLVASRLPATSWGVRAAGDPDRPVARVAVCGGSGDSHLDRARAAGADVYLTSDLKHHRTLEAVSERTRPGGPAPMAVVDAAHWATEAPWLDLIAARLGQRFPRVDLQVSRLVTDPWTVHRSQSPT
jgi:dinuclear metal center YbgI/SA1388 family protein